ncbi:PREDICTED: VQ motif-containing protein 4-like [Ipomoea nil]|uniref:VQ motif-containing protein 4-like n=1 Tax=Ipomoea nil TaxID=35883 RepID=UPI00090171C8|nr:PREDICTED: VQ motif-containing protein 4-like [Ipomoea nil]
MEITSRPPRQESGLASSQNDGGISSTTANCSSSLPLHHQIPTPPLTPKPISRSDASPYPTTFVQADTSTFKQVVQMLTGSSETAKNASKPGLSDPPPPPPNNKGFCSIPPKKQGFKALYERRNSLKNGLMISPLIPAGLITNSGYSPRKPEILSPSILDFPSLALSPVTPLNEDPFHKSSPSIMRNSSEEEEKAIAEKKFYLHPSPRASTPRDSEPQLLPLFPLTSPRVSSSSSSGRILT